MSKHQRFPAKREHRRTAEAADSLTESGPVSPDVVLEDDFWQSSKNGPSAKLKRAVLTLQVSRLSRTKSVQRSKRRCDAAKNVRALLDCRLYRYVSLTIIFFLLYAEDVRVLATTKATDDIWQSTLLTHDAEVSSR